MEQMDLKTDPNLLRSIDEAKNRTPSQSELRQQRVSFIYGSVGDSTTITHDRIRHVLDAQFGKASA